jgi:hypothetical protein
MRRVLLILLATAAGALAAGALATLPAAGSAGSPGESTPSSSSSCPTSNPPDEMKLVAGSPQSATLGGAFATGLQVALVNSDGCPVTGAAGAAVTFTAPTSGASGTFAGSGSSAVTVGANAQGAASAPPLSANPTPGDYAVSAVSAYGSVSFSLTNSAAGVPATLNPISAARSATSVMGRYSQPLQVQVLDANGAPLAGISISFTVTAASGADACGTAQGAGASFVGGAAQASATTDAAGVASSPALIANAQAGSFSASAALAAGSHASESASIPSVAPLSFALTNLPGVPAKLTAGVGAAQAAAPGERFPIRLAVTVADAQKNPVAGALVTFSAPATGASGSFLVDRRSRQIHTRVVQVKSDACGVAVAPTFNADQRTGGYVVRASVAQVRAKHRLVAAFALVNRSG